MSYSACIAVAGLVLDILGVAILFAKTSPRHIEAYITVSMLEGITPRENEEWTHPYSYEEHLRRLSKSKMRLMQTQRWTRGALGLIVAGFILQAIGLIL
jgi:UPF0716 family protein affecting phage T7 exclusion